ncbi:hypothetical protein CLOM_g21139 [Closterium sp. NIES-68]|nr:hypothetical protein CLOM_g21139 [Closterium sp. NIES-68]GJP75231.1 hypothetical protein CLOP_g5690 [Closterium sp. NIES-67]
MWRFAGSRKSRPIFRSFLAKAFRAASSLPSVLPSPAFFPLSSSPFPSTPRRSLSPNVTPPLSTAPRSFPIPSASSAVPFESAVSQPAAVRSEPVSRQILDLDAADCNPRSASSTGYSLQFNPAGYLSSCINRISTAPLLQTANGSRGGSRRWLHHVAGGELRDGGSVEVGQPTPESHPELLGPNDILPGVTTAEFAARRKAVMSRLPHGSVLVVGAAPVRYMAGIVPFPYRPDSDMVYLTGCWHPGVVAVIESRGGEGQGPEVQFSLFLPRQQADMVVWDGRALDPPAATAFFKPDRALFMDALDEYLLEAQRRTSAHRPSSSSTSSFGLSPPPRIFCDHRANRDLIATVPALAAELATGQLLSSRSALDEQRWIKSEAEQGLMRRAAEIAGEAFLTAMRETAAVAGAAAAGGGGGGCGSAAHKEGHMGGSSPHEAHIAALIEFECKWRGAQRFAYPPVVAGGASACVVHYLRNDKPVQPGEALLVDAGCEYFGYASDITRVWPPFGRFSPAQRAVYEAVRQAMVECIAMCKPGATLRDIHQHSVIALSSALVQLGVCTGSAQQAARGAFRQFYPTSVGHWLGLDTHDSASVSALQPLKPGVVLTIEPGLYLPDIEQVPKHLRGIGVRIEDDILITADGNENLTAAVPADVDALEALMAEAKENRCR